MRTLWATLNDPPSAEDFAAAAQAGAGEIVHLPCPALPELAQGLNTVAEAGDPPTDLAGAQALQIAALADERWTRSQVTQATLGGVTFEAPCDTAAGTNVIGAIVGLQLASSSGPIDWKLGPGVFAPLTLADLVTLGQTMRGHVQACFVNEAQISARILAAQSASDALAVDLTQGWPS